MDTSNILFICGGAFDGLERSSATVPNKSSLGFGGTVKSKAEVEEQGIYRQVEPHDLVKYGLIPELVGRIPIIASLDALDEEALVRILREPKKRPQSSNTKSCLRWIISKSISKRMRCVLSPKGDRA